MKHVQKKLALVTLGILLISGEAHAWGSKRPRASTPPPAPTPPAVTAPSLPIVPTPGSTYINTIKDFATNSSCAAYSWKSRGRAPAGYIRGVALTYARSLCRLKAAEMTPNSTAQVLSAARGDAAKDALAHYQLNFDNLPIALRASGAEPLRALYVLGTGLGMRESSGRYCEGRDMSASNTSASTAEAGIFQTSYDSFNASPELAKLYAEYRADTSKCYLDIFKVGVSCGNSSIAGSGAGADFQAFNKSCPAFATEYAMLMLRVRRNHYGPINRKEAEVIPACDQMLTSVQDLINNDPNACSDLL